MIDGSKELVLMLTNETFKEIPHSHEPSAAVITKCRKNCNGQVLCHVVQNSLLWKRGEEYYRKRKSYSAPLTDVQRQKQKTLDLTRGGKSNDIAQSLIITVFTAFKLLPRDPEKRHFLRPPCWAAE